jgi:hypothetical protein
MPDFTSVSNNFEVFSTFVCAWCLALRAAVISRASYRITAFEALQSFHKEISTARHTAQPLHCSGWAGFRASFAAEHLSL